MMQELLEAVEANAAHEKERASKKYGPIKSAAEGYGVLAEEVMEFRDEKIEDWNMDHILRCIQMGRLTERDTSRFDRDVCLMNELKEIRKKARNAAAEATQVVAVCDRFMEFIGGAN